MPSPNAWPEEIVSSKPAGILFRAAEEERFPQSVILAAKSPFALEALAERFAAAILEKAAPANCSPPPLAHHPDFFALRPAKKMRQISAENTRELIRKIHHSPRFAARKVAVVHEAERMNKSAFNIFLKTLEEPPADTVILLLTTQLYALLPTVRSRCLTFRFPEGGEETLPSPLRDWLDSYREWLDTVASGIRRPGEISAAALGAYGILTRFQQVLDDETKRIRDGLKENLPRDLDDDRQAAFEEGVKVSVRHRFFQEIERATHDFARTLAEREGTFPAKSLVAAIGRLEHSAGLLRVNLKEQAALEHFLLHSLRIWARR